MSSPATLDFDALLAPISEEYPAGSPIAESEQAAAAIRELNSAGKDALRAEQSQQMQASIQKSEGSGESINVDEESVDIDALWQNVFDHAETILKTESKDLRAAAWMIRALLPMKGVAGLRDGCQLARKLCHEYWSSIESWPDLADSCEVLRNTFAKLGENLRGVVLIWPTAGIDAAPLSLNQYEEAKENKEDESWDKLNQIAQNAPIESLRDLGDDLRESIEAVDALSQEILDRAGPDLAPPPASARQTLDQCLHCLQALAGDRLAQLPAEEAEQPAAGVVEAGGSSPAAPSAGLSGEIATREEALRLLQKVADYFRKNEPPSLLPDTLEQAIRRAKMSHGQLMRDLIRDESVLEDVLRLTGGKAETSGEGSE